MGKPFRLISSLASLPAPRPAVEEAVKLFLMKFCSKLLLEPADMSLAGPVAEVREIFSGSNSAGPKSGNILVLNNSEMDNFSILGEAIYFFNWYSDRNNLLSCSLKQSDDKYLQTFHVSKIDRIKTLSEFFTKFFEIPHWKTEDDFAYLVYCNI